MFLLTCFSYYFSKNTIDMTFTFLLNFKARKKNKKKHVFHFSLQTETSINKPWIMALRWSKWSINHLRK